MTDGQEGEGMGEPMKDHMKEKRMMNVENEQNIFEKETAEQWSMVTLADAVLHTQNTLTGVCLCTTQ